MSAGVGMPSALHWTSKRRYWFGTFMMVADSAKAGYVSSSPLSLPPFQ